uniref:Retrotransposon protein, putative, Ty1-copia subclass n=1 Tax=Oryza sativa subsp. japonica TaxID=39947 RepID=Q338K6_ORYSJ|nr:retrotransposon protein, putative, Ty1-copia subclass [Oryza sativa Japonica Group]
MECHQIYATCRTCIEVAERPVAQQELLAVAGVDEGAHHASGEEDEPSWTNKEQSRKALPKNLIAAFSQCRTSKVEVPETYSPDRRCTPASGME